MAIRKKVIVNIDVVRLLPPSAVWQKVIVVLGVEQLGASIRAEIECFAKVEPHRVLPAHRRHCDAIEVARKLSLVFFEAV